MTECNGSSITLSWSILGAADETRTAGDTFTIPTDAVLVDGEVKFKTFNNVANEFYQDIVGTVNVCDYTDVKATAASTPPIEYNASNVSVLALTLGGP